MQGGSADGIKQALIDLATRLPENAKIVSTVHDEIIIECDRTQAEAVRELLSMVDWSMGALFPQVPIEVKAGICSTPGGF